MYLVMKTTAVASRGGRTGIATRAKADHFVLLTSITFFVFRGRRREREARSLVTPDVWALLPGRGGHVQT